MKQFTITIILVFSVLNVIAQTLNFSLNLASGMYFIRLTGKQKSAVQKFIINK